MSSFFPKYFWPIGPPPVFTEKTLETALVYMMCNDEDISAIVGVKVFPVIISRSALLPVITYQLIDSDYDYTLDGSINLVRCRYQLNCWAVTYKVARQLGNAVKALFDAYSGTVLDIPIRRIEIADESDMVEPPELEALKRFGKRVDLMVWYHEQI